MLYYKAFLIDKHENQKVLDNFNQGLQSVCYSYIYYYLLKIPRKIEFSLATTLNLNYDIAGNIINDFESNNPISNLFLNIFLINKHYYCLFSWFKKEDKFYRKYAKQFNALSYEDKKKYLNNLIPLKVVNLVISPRLWDYWGKDIQESLLLYIT